MAFLLQLAYQQKALSSMLTFKIYKFLAAVFTPDLSEARSARFLNLALELLGKRLDGEPVILPIPQDAPADIPRVLLSSADKKWSLQISLARTNLFYEPTIEDAVRVSVGEFGSVASSFFRPYQEKLDLRVQRLALVTERISQEEAPASYIVDKFCKKELGQKGGPFSNMRGFEVNSLKRYQWEGFKLNSWVKFRSAHRGTKPEDKFRVIVLQNDLNTLPYDEDPEQEFSPQDIERFFYKTPGHLNEVLEVFSVSQEDANT